MNTLDLVYLVISSAMLVIISITMLARANDLGWRPGLVWFLRRIGFIMAGFAPWAMVYIDIKSRTPPNLYEMIFRTGIGLVFVTTPYLPPWWRWITGKADIRDPKWSDDRRGVPERRPGV